MNWSDALILGRVSNLPTVWTNMIAASVLVGASGISLISLPLAFALSLFYIGGMYLNDAFDAEADRASRSDRPIPAGRVSESTVTTFGFGMLVLALIVLLAIGNDTTSAGQPFVGGVVLAGLIVLYDAWHKENPLSPVIMGLCRVMVYITTALCFSAIIPDAVYGGAFAILCYLIGLTYIAKQEDLNTIGSLWPLAFLAVPLIYGLQLTGQSGWTWLYLLIFAGWVLFALNFVKRRGPGDIPRAVLSLIAGMCLLDAVLIAGYGEPLWALLGLVGFAATLALQRAVPGT